VDEEGWGALCDMTTATTSGCAVSFNNAYLSNFCHLQCSVSVSVSVSIVIVSTMFSFTSAMISTLPLPLPLPPKYVGPCYVRSVKLENCHSLQSRIFNVHEQPNSMNSQYTYRKEPKHC
jgi:hypothetical protein